MLAATLGLIAVQDIGDAFRYYIICESEYIEANKWIYLLFRAKDRQMCAMRAEEGVRGIGLFVVDEGCLDVLVAGAGAREGANAM